MSISDQTTSYCEYCKGVLLTTQELQSGSHESCQNSILDFHNSLTSNIEYFRLDQNEYIAILQLEELNSFFSSKSDQNSNFLTTGLFNNKISSITIDLENSSKIKETNLPDFYNIFENFKGLMSLTVKNTSFHILDRFLQIPNRIFFLNISSNHLEVLPLSLFKMTSLRILNLSDNNISELPIHMNNFSLLNSLHLSNNRLERLPRFMMNYKKLTTLKINGNKLSSFPYSIMFLSNLSDLDISNNLITSIPLNIKYLSHLSTLNASNNVIKTISDVFQTLRNLKLVDLSNNQLKSLPISLLKNEKLHALNASGNKIKEINALPKSLTSVNLANNDLTELPEKLFLKMTHLTNVNLSDNKLSKIPQSLLNLPNLKFLKVSGNLLDAPIEDFKTNPSTIII